jgi:hypothetical protein
MCNDHLLKVDVETIRQKFSGLKIRVVFPDGVPDLAPRCLLAHAVGVSYNILNTAYSRTSDHRGRTSPVS